MDRSLYALHDSDEDNTDGAIPINYSHAVDFNERGYGIYWVVNDFYGSRRIKNLKNIRAWYVELDEASKANQLGMIAICPAPPSLVIESKRGFHLYWNARNAKLENYKIIQRGLREYFGGDENAQDVTRLLRAPGFMHMKDPSNPFLVTIQDNLETTYSEELMQFNYPASEDTKKPIAPYVHKLMKKHGTNFWERVFSIDCEQALRRLSGTTFVNGEQYSFKSVGGGKLNILVNGKGTSCWIDADKKIGSSKRGGPRIYDWVRWYGYSDKETVRILKYMFPELDSK